MASVGRSLGNIFANKLKYEPQYKDNYLISEIGNIVATVCLAHDMGNPSFGHSGEKSISHFFMKEKSLNIKEEVTSEQWHDLINFEGNANAFRILTHEFNGRVESPFSLTYSTLATLVKYPCESISEKDKNKIHQKKYGFFNSEKQTFEKIAHHLDLIQFNINPDSYYRHPLVFLVEAADDICYNIIDVEDAHRLKIFSTHEVEDMFLPLMGDDLQKVKDRAHKIIDANDRISFLRAKAINNLINQCSDTFWKLQDTICSGKHNKDIKSSLDSQFVEQLKVIERFSIDKIYNHQTVLEKEIAGYKVIAGLLEEFVPAVLEENKSHYNEKLIKLMPGQYQIQSEDTYSNVQTVLDFVSGMTDLYAVELYRKIKGISFPEMT
jgi:dGTPase